MFDKFYKTYDTAGKLKNSSNTEMLEIYSLNKIARGRDISKEPVPGFMQLEKKAKYNAWKAEADKGTTPEAAEKQYIEKAEALVAKYGLKE